MNRPSSYFSSTRGFTLIEIMVVVVIIGIMAAMVTLNVVNDDPSRKLMSEAKRFVAVVSHASDEASFMQQELGIVSTEDGYKFVRYEKVDPPATVGSGQPSASTTTNTTATSTNSSGSTSSNTTPTIDPKWVLIENSRTLGEYELIEEIRLVLELEESDFVKIGEQETVNGETEFTKSNLNLDDIGPKIDEDVEYEPSVYILSSGEMTPFVAEFFLVRDSEISVIVRGDDFGRVKIDFGDDLE